MEGSVEFLTDKYDNNKIVLNKGEEGLFNFNTGVMHKSKIKDMNFDAWNTRELVFDNTPFDQVILTLQKYFNITIVFEGESAGLNITTRYKDPSLQKVMNELHALAGINSEFKNDTLFIK
jgi:ferric-dicitrate binding protein FerR (iron transport regulator)